MKRYAIVRVDNKCPAYENINLCNEENTTCEDCKVNKNYGDTKKQLVLKVAQVLFRRKVKLYRKIWGSNMGSVERQDTYERCLCCAKEIVEFLGVE